jgi:ABC-type transporter Mla MlaB component
MIDGKPETGATAPAKARLRQLGPGQWCLEGPLTLDQVAVLARQAAPGAEAPAVTLDLGGVCRSSSAAVALFLEWQATLRARGSELRLVAAPADLCRLAALSNVDGLLGLEGRDSITGAAAPAVLPPGA